MWHHAHDPAICREDSGNIAGGSVGVGRAGDITFRIAKGNLAVIFQPLQIIIGCKVIAFIMCHRDDHLLARSQPRRKGGCGAVNHFNRGVATDIFQPGIFDKDTWQEAGFQQDLKAVTDPHHRPAAGGMIQHGFHDWRAGSQRATPQIVTIGKAAGNDGKVNRVKRRFLVPDQRRATASQPFNGHHHVAVAIRSGKHDDGHTQCAEAHSLSPSAISIS